MTLISLNDAYKNEGKCYLAISNKKAIGVIIGSLRKYEENDYLDYKCPKMGIVNELVVSTNVRSMGIGKVLLGKMETYFKSINCEYVMIDVFAYNDGAIKFYENNNYHCRMYTDIKKI